MINHEFYFYEKDGLSNNEWSEISMYNKAGRLHYCDYQTSIALLIFSLPQYYCKSNTVVISNEISIKEYPVRCNIRSKKITEIETWYETNFLLDLNYVLYITIITRGTTQEQEEGNQKWFVAW